MFGDMECRRKRFLIKLTRDSLWKARVWLGNFDVHLRDAGLGQISEVFSAEPPHTPGGCIAQAWSIAELLPSFERFAASLYRARRRPGKTLQTRTAVLGEPFDVAVDFVTPGDLEKSRCLAFCGKLKNKE